MPLAPNIGPISKPGEQIFEDLFFHKELMCGSSITGSSNRGVIAEYSYIRF